MRVFIAIPIPEPIKAQAARLQAEIRETASWEGIRWATSEQFHLTLQFLGEVDPNRLEDLEARTREACAGFPSFSLRAGQVGFFPNERRPRVLWAGLQCPTGQLAELQRAIEAATASFAEKQEERGFKAHLTLARIKSVTADQAGKLARQVATLAKRELGEWTADGVEIIQSQLHPTGSRYTTLTRIPLDPYSR